MTTSDMKEFFLGGRGEENILYMTIYTCQNYQNCTPKTAQFSSIQYSSKLEFLFFLNLWAARTGFVCFIFPKTQLNDTKEAEKGTNL